VSLFIDWRRQAMNTKDTWIRPIVSVIGLGIFIFAFVIAWLAKDDTSLKMLMGGALAIGMAVINYWLGSSSGSDRKTEMLAMSPPVPGMTMSSSPSPPASTITVTAPAPMPGVTVTPSPAVPVDDRFDVDKPPEPKP
jgi:hypothetical protein